RRELAQHERDHDRTGADARQREIAVDVHTCIQHVGRLEPELAPLRVGMAIERGERRSEEHTSELQSLTNLVCRLLLEKTKTITEPTRTRLSPNDGSGCSPASSRATPRRVSATCTTGRRPLSRSPSDRHSRR